MAEDNRMQYAEVMDPPDLSFAEKFQKAMEEAEEHGKGNLGVTAQALMVNLERLYEGEY